MIPALSELFAPEDIDQAAAHIHVFLHELIMQFDSQYFVHLRRHYAKHSPPRDPHRPWLPLPRTD